MDALYDNVDYLASQSAHLAGNSRAIEAGRGEHPSDSRTIGSSALETIDNLSVRLVIPAVKTAQGKDPWSSLVVRL